MSSGCHEYGAGLCLDLIRQLSRECLVIITRWGLLLPCTASMMCRLFPGPRVRYLLSTVTPQTRSQKSWTLLGNCLSQTFCHRDGKLTHWTVPTSEHWNGVELQKIIVGLGLVYSPGRCCYSIIVSKEQAWPKTVSLHWVPVHQSLRLFYPNFVSFSLGKNIFFLSLPKKARAC